MIIRFILVAITFYLALSVTSLKADWINLTGAETAANIAEIYVLDDHVKLALEIFVGDLEIFEELIPDDWLKESNVNRPNLEERLRLFSSKKFQFVTETGEGLQAKLALLEPRTRVDRKSPYAGMINPQTRQRVPSAPSDKRVLYVELLYPFKEEPKTLTLIPPLDDEGRALANIGFITYHKAVPVIDFRYLGSPANLSLDWNDPWYTKFDNPNLKRHHKSALMSFLYVEPYEVRHEILTRVKDLEEWMDLDLEDKKFININELEPLKKRIGEFLISKNVVRIDGKEIEPILDRSNYIKVSLTGIQLIEKPQPLEVSTAIVGVIISYITDGMPTEVTVDWELFTEQINQVPATAIDPAGPFLTYITSEDNQYTWHNYLKKFQMPSVKNIEVDASILYFQLPLGSLLCLSILIPLIWKSKKRRDARQNIFPQISLVLVALIAGIGLYFLPLASISIARPSIITPAISDDEASGLAKTLLKNVYRAFDFQREEHVYDKLALTVSGDLLVDIYLQNRKSLAIKKAGGAQAKIKQVDILDASAYPLAEGKLGYTMKAKWTALGTVGHWGHVHTRKNLYEANLKIEADGEIWKITELNMLDEKRIDPYKQI